MCKVLKWFMCLALGEKYLNALNVCCFDYGLKRLFISLNIKSWNLELNNSNNKHFCCEMVWNILCIVSHPKPIPSVLSLSLIFFFILIALLKTHYQTLVFVNWFGFFLIIIFFISYEETWGLQKCSMLWPKKSVLCQLFIFIW
jgi:hypothetical protein